MLKLNELLTGGKCSHVNTDTHPSSIHVHHWKSSDKDKEINPPENKKIDQRLVEEEIAIFLVSVNKKYEKTFTIGDLTTMRFGKYYTMARDKLPNNVFAPVTYKHLSALGVKEFTWINQGLVNSCPFGGFCYVTNCDADGDVRIIPVLNA